MLELQPYMSNAANTFGCGNQLCSWKSSVCSWHFCVNHLLQTRVILCLPGRYLNGSLLFVWNFGRGSADKC